MLKDLARRTGYNILKLITGASSKPLHGIAVFCGTIFFIGACLVAQSFFPVPYSILLHTISSQGNLIVNPYGQWYFNAGVFVTGLLLIPHFLYLTRRYAPTAGILSFLTTAAGIAGAVGLSLLGIYPSGGPCCHNFAASAAFNGCGIVGLLSFLVILIKIIKRDNAPRWGWFLLVFGLIAASAVFVGYINLMDPIINLLHLDPLVKNFAFREWSTLFIEMFWLISFFAILPNKQVTPLKEVVSDQIGKIGRIPTYTRITFQGAACIYIFFAVFYPTILFPLPIIDPELITINLPYINVGLWENLFVYIAIFVVVDQIVARVGIILRKRYLRMNEAQL